MTQHPFSKESSKVTKDNNTSTKNQCTYTIPTSQEKKKINKEIYFNA